MEKKKFNQRIVAVCIMFFFVGTATVPGIIGEGMNSNNVLTSIHNDNERQSEDNGPVSANPSGTHDGVQQIQNEKEKQSSYERTDAPWGLPDWQYRKQITINHTMVAGDLVNFPVLIKTTMDTSKVQPDGDDIVFTTNDSYKLNHEIESYDNATGELIAWVNVTSLSSIQDTILWMYYGNPTCSNQQNKYGTWNSDYVMVLHMNGASYTAITDSTAYKNNVTGVVESPTYQQTGRAGYAVQFPGTAYLTFSSPVRNTFPTTVEAWAKPTAFNNGNYFLSTGIESDGGGPGFSMDFDSSYGYNWLGFKNASNNKYTIMNTGTSLTGVWYYYGMSWTGTSTDNATFYVQSTKTSVAPGSTYIAGSSNLCIGINAYSKSNGFTGYIDEIRISKVVRADAWLLTSYNSINSPSTFLTLGNEQSHQSLWWNANWNYRRQITIDHTKVTGDLVNFPVLVKTIMDTSKVQPDGDDIVFTTNDSYKFNHEIESYNSTTGQLIAWVNVTSLSSTVDTVMWLYYGNSACTSQQNVAGTWNGGYKGVWHMNDGADTSHILDSTSYDSDGTKKGAAEPAVTTTAKIGLAQSFDGTDDYIETVDNTFDFGTGNFTFSCWFYHDDYNTGNEIVFGKADYDSVIDGILMQLYQNRLIGYFTDSGSAPEGVASHGSWQHVFLVHDSDNLRLYLNGSQVDVHTGYITYTLNNEYKFTIGVDKDRTGCFDGKIDEVRAYSSLLSANWISTEYSNQNSPSTFLTLSDEQSHQFLAANFTYAPENPTTNDTIQFTDTSIDSLGTIVAWLWDFGDGNTSTLQHTTHAYSHFGIYPVSLTVTDNDTNEDTIIKNVTVNNPPNADFTYTPMAPLISQIISFLDASTDLDGTIVSWQWDFGDSYTSLLQHPKHYFILPGNYTVTLTVQDNLGATDVLTQILNVHPGFVADIYIDDDYVDYLPGWGVTHFNNIQEGINAVINTGSIYVFNGFYPEHITIEKSLFLTGENNVDTIVDGGNTGNVFTITANDVILSNLKVQHGGNAGISLQTTANVSIVGNLIVDNGCGIDVRTTSNMNLLSENTITGNTRGIFVYDDSNENTISQNIISGSSQAGIRLEHLCIGNMIVENTISQCANGIYLYDACNNNMIYHNNLVGNTKNARDYCPINYWDNGSGGNFWSDYTGVDGNHDGIGDTPYNVYGGGNKDHYPFMYQTGWIDYPPNVQFTYQPVSPTTADIISFTDQSTDIDGTVVSWLWSFGDDTTSTEQNPTHQYSDEGVYTVILNITDNDGSFNETSQQITVGNVGPTADFTYDPENPTINDVIQFTDTSFDSDGTIVLWYWDLGDGNTSDAQNPTHQYSIDGQYEVSLTVTDDDNAIDTIDKPLIVSSGPITYVYVDDDYDASTPGWQIDHFNQIQDGINTVVEGGTVYVYSGIYYENVVLSKDNIHLVGQDKNTTIIDANGIGNALYIAYHNNNQISDFTIRNAGEQGVYIYASSSTHSWLSQNNMLKNCIITGNSGNGVYIHPTGYGCRIHDTKILNCEISENDGNGIYLHAEGNHCSIGYSTNITLISDCVIKNNSADGIRTFAENHHSFISFTKVMNCTIAGNNGYGIDVMLTPDCWNDAHIIYHNNFINNGQNAYDAYDSSVNKWYNADIQEGNYWSDYIGEDNNHDGIGDIPYSIPGGNNQDLYPFMQQNGWLLPPPNQPPIANFTYAPENPITSDVISFTDTSSDIDGNIVAWSWDFGDGNTSTIQNPIHQYTNQNTYTVTLTVTDDDGASDSVEKTITVTETGPRTIYVDDDNTAGPWDGSLEHPYQHIQDGVNAVNPGYTIYVYNGTYNESLVISEKNTLTLIGENKKTTIINAIDSEINMGSIYVETSYSFRISGFTLRGFNAPCIYFRDLFDSLAYDCILKDSNYGGAIYTEYTSENNTIRDCEIYNNNVGIGVHGAAENYYLNRSNILNCYIHNNGIGILVYGRSDWYGVINHTTINGCSIFNNTENSIFINQLLGKILGATIYHNNIINNADNVYDNGTNTWYNFTLHEGNYWSDYTGIDANHDGIGDTPYNIPGGSNQDLYPFMQPNGWLYPQPHNWWDSNWSYCKKIIIDHTQVAGDLSNFPVLIHNISTDFINHAQPDGDDFVFINATNTTKYNHEIESYNSETGNLIAWVNIPHLSSTQDTILYLYYGNPISTNQQNPSDVWDDNYVAVWHFGETTGDIISDSTHNMFNGQANEYTTVSNGIIGLSRSFDGSNSDIYIGTQSEFGGMPAYTIEAWGYPYSVSGEQRIFDRSQSYDVNPNTILFFYYINDDFALTTNNYDGVGAPGLLEPNKWCYLAGTFIGSGGEKALYANGLKAATGISHDPCPTPGNFAVHIGQCAFGWGLHWNGKLDEMRFSKTARNASWINTTFVNIQDPAFITSGIEQSRLPNQPPNIPSNPIPKDAEINVAINTILGWSGGDPDHSDAARYDVYFGTTNPPPIMANNQSSPFYDPGILQTNTTYFWKIIAWDTYGESTPGPVWSFTSQQSGYINAWGDNRYNQCNVPFPNNDFIAVSAGALHSLGLKVDGSIIAWGENGDSQCNVPEPNTNYIAVSAGGYHSLGLKADGSIVAWGRNNYGQCNVPEPNTDFIAIAASWSHNLGLKADGSIIAWGDNRYNQCNVPFPNNDFIAVSAGEFHSLGLKANSSIIAWGGNYYGQCNVPEPNTNFIAVAAGWAHNLGLKADGSIVAWGWNGYGECNVPEPNTNFSAISAGGEHNLGLRHNSSIIAWGDNGQGQSNVPTPNTNFITVAAGWLHSLGIKLNNPPYTPSNPNPSDNASNVPVNMLLSWTGGDPDLVDTVTYDIFFGTTIPPSQVVWNQTETIYDPGLLELETKYYWQIIARDNHGALTPGPIWNFMTIAPPNQPPFANFTYAPENPTTNDIILFTDTSIDTDGTIVSWSWDFGDGNTSNLQNPTHQYITVGTYNVTLTVTDNDAASDFTVKAIIVTEAGPPENWTEMQKLLASDGIAWNYFGYPVSLDGDTALIGAPKYYSNGDGSAYVFTRTGTTWTQQAELLASDGATGDDFGISVSLSGDTALIGAWWDDDNGVDSGSAYVFTRTAGIWTQQAKLLASDGVANAYFGFSVSLNGDTALIGTPWDDDNGVHSGSVYVFTRTGITWTQQTKLLPSDSKTEDDFGYSVSLIGNTALIGTVWDDDNGYESGSAYVFIRNETTWTQQAKLLASDGVANAYFGCSVSLNGDTALIGALQDDDNGHYSGSAYVFIRNGITWTQQTKLLPSDGTTNDQFGVSVSLLGETALIGAWLDDDNGYMFGSAYVFTRTGITWTQQAKLLASDGVANAYFGCSVSLSGNIALIGAFGDDDMGSNSGSVYVFTRESVNQPPVANFTFTPENPTNIDFIQFTDTSNDPDGTIVLWFWNFGDGNTSTLQNPTYRYIHGGTYTVTLTVTDDDGSQNTMNTTIIVTTVNHPPNTPTTPSGPTKGIAGIEYAYSTQTTDPEGDFIKYGWDWDGNSIVDTWTSLMPSGMILTIHHLWPDVGSYTIRVKAKDKYGLESNWSESLPVRMYLLGDINGDDTMNFGDINPFVLALTAGEAGYYNAYPNGYYYTADCNLDGAVNFGDINPFVALLTRQK